MRAAFAILLSPSLGAADPTEGSDVASSIAKFANRGAHPVAAGEPDPGHASEFRDAHADFGERSRRFTPVLELGALYVPEGKVHKEKGDFELEHYKLDALLPVPLDRDTFLLAGAHAGVRRYDFHEVSGAEDESLYNAGLRLGAGRFFGDDLAVQGYWQPSLYSDLDGTLKSRDWKLWYGVAFATLRVRDDLFLKGGVALTDAFDTGAVPVVGLSWIFHPAWRLDVLFPRNAEVSWDVSSSLRLQAGCDMDAEEFHIRISAPRGSQETDIHVQDIRAFLGAIYRLSASFALFAKLGTSVAGHYEWRDGTGERFDGTLGPAFFLQGGIGLSF